MVFVIGSAADAVGQSRFTINEAREEGGTIWEWLALLGAIYLTGLLLLFPALLIKYRHHRSEIGYVATCGRAAVTGTGGFTRVAFVVILFGVPVVLFPSAIVVGVVNFGFFGGRNDALVEWWLTGVVVLVALAACVIGVRSQLKETTDPFSPGSSRSRGA